MTQSKFKLLVERRGDRLAVDIDGHETYTVGLEFLFYRHAYLTEPYQREMGNRPPEDFALHCWDLARQRTAQYVERTTT